MPDVFISYSRRDSKFMHQLDESLRQDEYDVWVDHEDIPDTVDWWDEVRRGIEASDNFVFILSPNSAASPVCNLEMAHARYHEKRVIPLLLTETESHETIKTLVASSLPPNLQDVLAGRDLEEIGKDNWRKVGSHNWLDFQKPDDYSTTYDRLKEAIKTDHDHARQHSRLVVKATEWDENQRNGSFLLRGEELKDAEVWLKANEAVTSPKVTETQTQLILASQLRRQREQRLLAGILIMFLAVALLLTLFAFLQRGEAIAARKEVETQVVIAEDNASTATIAQGQAENNAATATIAQGQAENNAATATIAQGQAENNAATATIAQGQAENNAATATIAQGQAENNAATATIAQGQAENNAATATIAQGQAENNAATATIAQGQAENNAATATIAQGQAENNAATATVAQGQAENNAATATVAQGQAENNAATAVAAQREAERNADEASSLLWANYAAQAFEDSDLGLAIPLALHAVRIDDPPILSQAVLADVAYAPGFVARLTDHYLRVNSIAISPDGLTALSASDDTTLILWDIDPASTTYRQGTRWEGGHASLVNSVAFSPDGTQALSGSNDMTLILWDVASGQPLRTLAGHQAAVLAVAFHPGGERALSGSADTTLISWNLRTGKALDVLEGHTDWVHSVAFSPTGGRALSASADHSIIKWNVDTGEDVRTWEYHGSEVRSIVFSPNGRTALSASDDRTLILWDVDNGDVLRVFEGHEWAVNNAVFSPDGTRAASVSDDRTVILWDVETGDALRVFTGHDTLVLSLAFHPDDQRILSGDLSGDMIIWDARDPTFTVGAMTGTLQGAPEEVKTIAISPDGRLALSAGQFAHITLWNLETGEIVHRMSDERPPSPGLAFTPDGSRALTSRCAQFDMTEGCIGGEFTLWDVATGDVIRTFSGHQRNTWGLDISPDGQRVLTTSCDRDIILWDLNTGEPLRTLSGHDGCVLDVAFSPDGRLAVSGGNVAPTLLFWDVETGQVIHSPEGHGHRMVRGVAFSPDGTQALSASDDGTLILWDVATGQPVRVFSGHTNVVHSVDFGPEGRLALSGAADNSLILWDVASGQRLRTFRGHIGPVVSVALSPVGGMALSGSIDTSLMSWRIDTLPQLVTWTYANRSVRELTCTEREVFRVRPFCGDAQAYPTSTPYPTLTPGP